MAQYKSEPLSLDLYYILSAERGLLLWLLRFLFGWLPRDTG